MPTPSQLSAFYSSLKDYRKKYLLERYESLDESATRLMINKFLTDILGYTELDEIKTEYAIKGTYADYVIQVDRKKHFVVEVKAVQIDLSEKHLWQAVNYAANEGIDWILLTNGRAFEIYKVIFAKPISYKKICGFDLKDDSQLKAAVDFLILLSKKEVAKDALEHFWKRFQALEPMNLCKVLYTPDVVRLLRKSLKNKTGLSFSEDDIFDSIHQIVVNKIVIEKPRYQAKQKAKSGKTVNENSAVLAIENPNEPEVVV